MASAQNGSPASSRFAFMARLGQIKIRFSQCGVKLQENLPSQRRRLLPARVNHFQDNDQ